MEDNRKKALAAALGQIEKQFGKGSVMRLGDAACVLTTSRLYRPARSASTSRSASAACRAAASVEIYGPESSGKTTLTLQVDRRGAETGRHRRLRRCRARARSLVR